MKKRELTPEDCDFSRVPSWQLQACELYEFSRESPTITKLIRERLEVIPGTNPPIQKRDSYLDSAVILKYSTFIGSDLADIYFAIGTGKFLPVRVPGFPDKPWQKAYYRKIRLDCAVMLPLFRAC